MVDALAQTATRIGTQIEDDSLHPLIDETFRCSHKFIMRGGGKPVYLDIACLRMQHVVGIHGGDWDIVPCDSKVHRCRCSGTGYQDINRCTDFSTQPTINIVDAIYEGFRIIDDDD